MCCILKISTVKKQIYVSLFDRFLIIYYQVSYSWYYMGFNHAEKNQWLYRTHTSVVLTTRLGMTDNYLLPVSIQWGVRRKGYAIHPPKDFQFTMRWSFLMEKDFSKSAKCASMWTWTKNLPVWPSTGQLQTGISSMCFIVDTTAVAFSKEERQRKRIRILDRCQRSLEQSQY